ncbi:hypothetical protein VTN77DRAFT_2703 [Rasamsonia byssochlamydoides]|uniref:uncharacterized protein n=1 Tax=Rasamsonia byssochlamydoides TaxID=89139 RepID=UPI0037433ADB
MRRATTEYVQGTMERATTALSAVLSAAGRHRFAFLGNLRAAPNNLWGDARTYGVPTILNQNH